MYNPCMSHLVLYHGSDHIIEKPEYGAGRIHNDYGSGFYCTMDQELAMEWSINGPDKDGYVNEYAFDATGLKVLDLSGENILSWISILVSNRTFDVKGGLAGAALTYLKDHFLIDYSDSDVIYGWRADDSYFAYANDFINGAISVQRLGRAMKLGNLGMQYVLKSKTAFERITFKTAIPVSAREYYGRRMKRDREAREGYLYGERFALDKDDLFIADIMRQEIDRNDPRLW